MTDIVERLREQPTMSSFANIGDMVGRLNHEREEAADEIERLRWALDFIIRVDRLNDAKVAARAALGEKD